jgi:hypothetical protein
MADTILRVLLDLRRHGVEVRNLVVTALPSLPSYPLQRERKRRKKVRNYSLCLFLAHDPHEHGKEGKGVSPASPTRFKSHLPAQAVLVPPVAETTTNRARACPRRPVVRALHCEASSC